MASCKCIPPATAGRGGKVDKDVLSKLDRGYARLKACKTDSLLKIYLTPPAYDILRRRKTSYGSSFWDVVQSGMANTESKVGVYAPDPEAYTVYRPLFNAIVDDYHGDFDRDKTQPLPSWGNPARLFNHDPEDKYIVAARVRVCRNLADYPFTPCLTRGLYKKIEDTIIPVLQNLGGEFKGTYTPLEKMTPTLERELIKDHYLFPRCNKYLLAANAGRFWPTGRGIFMNDKCTFIVWLGKEDHVRIISMDEGPNLKEAYGRLLRAMRILDSELDFIRDNRLGYLTMCPTNLGTTLRASVLIKLPDLKDEEIRDLAEKNNLEIRGTYGEFTSVENGVYDISNKKRLGLTEFEAVKILHDGIGKLIWEQEKREIQSNKKARDKELEESINKWVEKSEKEKLDEKEHVDDKNEEGEKTEEGKEKSKKKRNKKGADDKTESPKLEPPEEVPEETPAEQTEGTEEKTPESEEKHGDEENVGDTEGNKEKEETPA